MNHKHLPEWKAAWRRAICPQLTTDDLALLLQALETDSDELIQGNTTDPVPVQPNMEKQVRAACPISYVAWKSRGKQTVDQVEQFFSELVYQADRTMGYPTATRPFFEFWDGSTRRKARKGLLVEVQLALLDREWSVPIPA